MQVIVSVRVSLRVKIAVNPNPTAQSAAAMRPGLMVAEPGRAMIRIPTKPMIAEMAPMGVIFSRNMSGERRITQIGVVNSNAKTWASGITVIA